MHTPGIEGLSAPHRWSRALLALKRLAQNPGDTQAALEFGVHLNAGRIAERAQRLLEDPEGRRLYESRRFIDRSTVDLDALAKLPADTLGGAYARFMRSRGITPEIFEAPPGLADPVATYLTLRVRQTHDLWHVLTGYDTDVPGEIELQAFTYGQLGAPSALLLGGLGALRRRRVDPHALTRARAAYRRGLATARLIPFPWEDHWSAPLSALRASLRCPPHEVHDAH